MDSPSRRRRRRRRRRAYAPTSNTASHDNHEKINPRVSFSFLNGYGAPLGALRVAGTPLLFFKVKCIRNIVSIVLTDVCDSNSPRNR